ncbi:MAG: hypothetical protein HY701_13875 [Gemmatimonadetes bacterium]|nr:hypothetical protein [Gemmatimonadota bacterium]
MAQGFTAEERRALIRDLRERSHADCPACGGPLSQAPVPPQPDLAYVRERIWITCAACGRSAVVDRGEIGPVKP